MIDKFSARIAQNLLTAQALDEKDINLYQYAIQVLICTLLNYSAFVVIGIIFGMFWENFIMQVGIMQTNIGIALLVPLQ